MLAYFFNCCQWKCCIEGAEHLFLRWALYIYLLHWVTFMFNLSKTQHSSRSLFTQQSNQSGEQHYKHYFSTSDYIVFTLMLILIKTKT